MQLSLQIFLSLLFLWLSQNVAGQNAADSQSHHEGIKALLDSAQVHLKTAPTRALSFLERAENSIDIENLDELKPKAHYMRWAIFMEMDQPDQAIQALNHGFRRAEKLGDKNLIFEGYQNFINHYKSDNQKGLDYAREGIQTAVEMQLPIREAEMSSALGSIFMGVTAYDSAMHYFTRAIAIYETRGDLKGTYQTLSKIVGLHLETLNQDQALVYLNRITDIVEELGDSVGLCQNLLQRGVVHQKSRNHEEALVFYRRALKMSEDLGMKGETAVINGNIGSSLVALNDSSGIAYLREALHMKEENNMSQKSILHTLMDLAEAEIYFARPDRALSYAENVVEKAKENQDGYSLKFGYFFLSKSHRELGDYKQAYDFQTLYIRTKDSLFDLDRAVQINQMEIAYETEKKDQAIADFEREKEVALFRNRMYLIVAIILLALGAVVYNQQRLRAIRNRQLLEKEQEVDRLKSNFFANISHEFRTPLALIIGPLETMSEKVTDDEVKTQLSLMRRNANRLLRLINDILDLTKIEAGDQSLRPSLIDAVAVIRGVAMSFSSLAEAKNIQFDVSMPAKIENAWFEQSRLETILINLLSNAFKFTPDGGSVTLRVEVETGETTSEFKALEIKVGDTGAGIPSDKLARIFDRFYQVDDSATRRHQGTGIGLSYTRELVLLHRGTIDVESAVAGGNEVQPGTTVRVVLPLGNKPSRQPAPADETGITIPPEPAMFPERNPTPPDMDFEKYGEEKPLVLIIEDNSDVRIYLRSILGKHYQINEAADGEAGIDAAFKIIPDLVISDVMMPRKDGYEVSRTLKNDMRTSHIPLVLLTAKSSAESRLEGLETQADVYLNKPFLPRELLLQVQNLIESRKKLRERYQKENLLLPAEIATNSVDEQFLTRLMEIMELHFSDPEFGVEDLGSHIGLSRSQLHRKLHALTNENTTQFIRTFRLRRAMDMLDAKSGNISEIAYLVGFNNVSYFNKCFLALFGKRPGDVKGWK